MPIKKPGFTSPFPIARLPGAIATPEVGPRIITPGRKATAGVIGQRLQPIPKGNGGNRNGGNGKGDKSGNEKK
ncbi:hypothetical protein KTE11_07220 [Burkholderia multivorans]|uniref:hypothetical protein n=1 Tax=Burkholderia multivorans TaxID=87883 RepID=UPI001C2675FE|nr:hypothetical protein [Burkholderia multivorans]MBU9344510.1 hypothetical protein [Burkholderia multivorans]